MGGINLARVLIGGLLAGLIYNVSGMIAGYVVDLAESFARFGFQPSTGALIQHLAARFAFGLVSVFTYAAIRPRFGPGLKTAMIAACILWVAAAVPLVLMMTELLIFDGAQALIMLVWTLVEACVATSVGGSLYQELDTRTAESP